MNILIYRYGSICEPDVITGFEELGNHVHEITAEIYNKDLDPLSLLDRGQSGYGIILLFHQKSMEPHFFI